jgi:hypothetical protein
MLGLGLSLYKNVKKAGGSLLIYIWNLAGLNWNNTIKTWN